jgi:hypothetical protein
MIGFIGTSLQLQSIIPAHKFNSFWTTSVWRIFMKNLSLVSDWLSSTTHECTDFYNFHAPRIEFTASKASINVLFCFHGNDFV